MVSVSWRCVQTQSLQQGLVLLYPPRRTQQQLLQASHSVQGCGDATARPRASTYLSMCVARLLSTVFRKALKEGLVSLH